MKQLQRWLTNGLMHHCLEHPNIALFVSTHPNRGTTTAEIKKIRTAGNKNPEATLDAWEAFLEPTIAHVDKFAMVGLFIFVLNTRRTAFAEVAPPHPQLLPTRISLLWYL